MDAHLSFQSVEAKSFEDAAKKARRSAEKSGWRVGDIAEVKFSRFYDPSEECKVLL
jgi:hypothetical protein